MKKWKIQNNTLVTPQNIVELLLTNRNITTKKEKENFLNPRLSDLSLENASLDKKMLQKALERIQRAIENKEQVIVFGDYDVDGITGAAILWESLRDLGASVLPYIPHRIDEGYGLSVPGIKNILEANPDIKLIITVDNGIVAHEAVSFAKRLGIDVIITDHHLPTKGEKSDPEAYVIVHTTKLCGAGVALMLSQALKTSLKSSDLGGDFDSEHLALAALGTIADLVPLVGPNRVIVKYGIEKLRQTKRLGILELCQTAGIDKNKLDTFEIGFMIAPRLNAAGRMEHAMDSLRLLCTINQSRASSLAQKLSMINANRQEIQKESVLQAFSQVNSQKRKKLLFISHESYQEGIIGLVAGKLVEEFYRPAIVVSVGAEKSKASARSVSGFNIIDFIRTGSEYLLNAGGHPMAAGFTLETAKLALLQEYLENKAEKILTDELLVKTILIDVKLDLALITPEFYAKIKHFAPFGMANPEPVFLTTGVKVTNCRSLGKDMKHLKMSVGKDNAQFEAIAFGMGARLPELKEGQIIDLVYTIDQNTWNGNTKLQLKVKDFKLRN